MDNAGWHARRKAAQQEEGELRPSRGSDDQCLPVAQVETMEDTSIRGWATGTPGQPSSHLTHPNGNGIAGTQSSVRAPPPALSAPLQNGHPVAYRPPSSRPDVIQGIRPSFDQDPLSQLSPVERSRILKLRKVMMNPRLQFMCGPLLRYDTIDEHGMWHGAALIVTADAESTYEPYPTLMCRWDTQNTSTFRRHPNSAHGADLGPHPADPMAQYYRRHVDDEQIEGPHVQERRVLGTELYVYGEGSGYVCAAPC